MIRIHISAIELPGGVTPTVTDRDFTVATIAAPTIQVEEEPEEDEEGLEGEEGEEGRRRRRGRGERRRRRLGRRRRVIRSLIRRFSGARQRGPQEAAMLLLVGLGNPGTKYENNRHNVGFMAVDALHDRYGKGPYRSKFGGHLAEAEIGGEKVHLFKPATYMNASGRAVRGVTRFFKIKNKDVTGALRRTRSGFGKDQGQAGRRRGRPQWHQEHQRQYRSGVQAGADRG